MRSWIHWINTRAKNFDMLRSILDSSIWFLDSSYQQLCQVDGQSNESNQSDKSVESNKSIEPHQCTNHSNRSCNCATGCCADSDNGNNYFGTARGKVKYYDDIGYRGEVSRNFNENLNEFHNIYPRIKDGDTKVKRNSTWVWDCYEHATTDSSIHDTESTDHRSNQHGARE